MKRLHQLVLQLRDSILLTHKELSYNKDMTKNQHVKFAKRKHQKQLKRNAKNKKLRFQRLMAKIADRKLRKYEYAD